MKKLFPVYKSGSQVICKSPICAMVLSFFLHIACGKDEGKEAPYYSRSNYRVESSLEDLVLFYAENCMEGKSQEESCVELQETIVNDLIESPHLAEACDGLDFCVLDDRVITEEFERILAAGNEFEPL